MQLSYPHNKRTYIDKFLLSLQALRKYAILHKQSPNMHLYIFLLKDVSKQADVF